MTAPRTKKRRAKRRGWGSQLAARATDGPHPFQIDNGAAARAREIPLDTLPASSRIRPWPATADTYHPSPLALVVLFLRRMHLVKLATRPLSWGQIARLLKISPRYARRLYLESNPDQ
jgi:hypothetical protein